ncbi:GDP-Mannose:GMP Antiporter (GMA) Family, partial [Trachipleistophora hominis]
VSNYKSTPSRSCMKTMHKLAFIPLYLLSSLVSTLLNKHITTALGFHPTFLLLLMQSVIIVALLVFLKTVNACSFVLNLRCMLYWIPAAAFMVLMIFSGLRALSHLSISMFTLFKNYSVIVIAVFELVLFGRAISRLSIMCFVMMIISGMLVDYSETVVDRAGYVWICINVIASAVYVIVLRMTIVHHIGVRRSETEESTSHGAERSGVNGTGFAGMNQTDKGLLRKMLHGTIESRRAGEKSDDVGTAYSDRACTTPVIVFCSEAARRVRNNRIGGYVRMFEGMGDRRPEQKPSKGSTEENVQGVNVCDDRMVKKATERKTKRKNVKYRPNDFEHLVYSQILSIPFLFLLSLFFDNYASIASFKRVLENDILSSPDYVDTFLLNMEKVSDLAIVHNILIIKAFIGDLLELSGSAYFDDKVFLFIVLSGVSVFFVALSTVWCLRSLSSTTLSMMGATNKIIVSMSGVFLGERIGWIKAVSIAVGGLASILYVETIRKE